MANRLPKYYMILSDLDNPLWKEYISHLNVICSGIYIDKCLSGELSHTWYGYDGSKRFHGVSCHAYGHTIDFENNPTILTLEEFFELKKEVEPSIIKVTSTHKKTVKSVAIHIEVEGQEIIDKLYLNICLVQGTIDKGYAGRVIELLDGIKSQLKV